MTHFKKISSFAFAGALCAAISSSLVSYGNAASTDAWKISVVGVEATPEQIASTYHVKRDSIREGEFAVMNDLKTPLEVIKGDAPVDIKEITMIESGLKLENSPAHYQSTDSTNPALYIGRPGLFNSTSPYTPPPALTWRYLSKNDSVEHAQPVSSTDKRFILFAQNHDKTYTVLSILRTTD